MFDEDVVTGSATTDLWCRKALHPLLQYCRPLTTPESSQLTSEFPQPKAMAIATGDDLKISFSLFCSIFGIGTLGLPADFSRAGWYIAIFAVLFMAFANTYSAIVCSKVLLVAPRSVRTYADLGEWCMGTPGRYLVLVSQMASCLLLPCAFLVLGGTLLDDLFPEAFSATTWICLMALTVLPVCLTPTLKEGAAAAFAGCVGTLVADVVGLGVLLHGMAGHPTPPTPHLTFKQVATTFGNLALAYNACVVIPALQRQHGDPTRMPRVVGVSLVIISVLFLLFACLGYSAVGCQISGNLLFTIYPDASTGLNALGFAPSWGAIVLSFLFMQLHITIAFAVLIAPAFYILERAVLGMHKFQQDDLEGLNYASTETPAVSDAPADGIEVLQRVRVSKSSIVSIADIERIDVDPEDEAKEYQGANAIKYVILRVVVIVLLVLASIALKDQFLDLTDFVGASCITVSSILLPIIFYLKKFWPTVPLYEKTAGIIVVVVCFVLGCYVTYTSGKELFDPSDSDVAFPFCDTEYQTTIYYVKSS